MADVDVDEDVDVHDYDEVQFEENEVPLEEDEENNNEDEVDLDFDSFPKAEDCGDERLKTVARFLLIMKLVCGVNQSNMNIVIEESKKLINFVYDAAVKKFEDLGCSLPVSVKSQSVKQQVCDVFKQLRTNYRQEKHFRETYKVIKPKCVNITAKFKKVGEGKKRKVVVVETNFYYIPILSVLEQLLQHPDFEVITKREYNPDPEILDGYIKGDLAKKNPVLIAHSNALRVILHYDELETCTALSPHASGNQKLGALYVTLDDIDPKFRGNLDTICLVALVNASFVKEHGLNVVLKRLTLDLKKLEKGVMMNLKTVYGVLIGVEGDNLGSHEVGGFKRGFTARKPCRTCSASLEDVRCGCLEVELRTPEQYDQQVATLENAKTKKIRDTKSTEYGVNLRSALNELSSYHVVGGLPPDLMQDVLEGSISRRVKHIVKHCVEDLGIITLNWLNSAIADFDYGYSEVSQKPLNIKADHLKDDGNLHQSSSQMWVLATILPLILGPLVDEEDTRYEHFIKLLEICRQVFSKEIKKNQLPYLSDLISSYQKGYIEHYGHLKPKDHFLGHYPYLWSQFGSLIDFQCMRMEANHKIFKKFVYTVGNYVNIPKTLALRYQSRQAIRWTEPLVKPIVYGIMKRQKLAQQPYSHLFKGVEEILECNWVKVERLVIKAEKCYLTIGCDEESNPVFAKVVNIIVWPELLFVCKRVQTITYDVHLGAYKIRDEETLRVCRRAVIVRRVYHCHNVQFSKYLCWRAIRPLKTFINLRQKYQ